MKTTLGVSVICVFALLALVPAGSADETKSLYDFSTHTLLGEETSLDQYRGQVCLVVNVASKCGLTPQYKGLQALQDELGDEDFTILGFPSNDFMGQEPGAPEEIAAFCEKNYGVTFPMFEKVKVKGDGKSEIYRYLSAEHEEPDWNFTKYLVGRDGQVIQRFDPRTAPEDPKLREQIEKAIKG
jgi:glutathione peroxidase